MALTQNTYTGDGSTVLFSFTFPYLATTDIKVSVDGVDTTAYSLANATQVQFTAAPANNSAVRIYRDTNVDDLTAEFFSGSAIRADDLNNDFNQILYSTQETVNRRVESTGGNMTGDLVMDNANIVFEGATDDAYETTLTVVDPTADNTIRLPNVTGDVVTTGDTSSISTGMVADSAITSAKIANGTIVDADVSASAELAVSKLADGSARQLLQTDAAGTGVEWASNIDVPGTLDVSGATTLDSGLAVTGNITVTGTVDGRDVATDGTKLDTVESGATADQTAAEIRTLVESATDSNVFTDADHTKLNGIEAGATADQTAAEIRSLVGNATDSNVYVDAHYNLVNAITATAAEINKLDGVTATTSELNVVDGVTATTSELNILDGVTSNASELNVLDGITASTTELNQLDGKTISGTLTPANTNDIPTSSAVNTFVSGLINALGGFVAIADELNFPNDNPDPSDNAGTVVSISDAGGIVVDSSGNSTTGRTVGGSTVTITGFPSSLQSSTLVSGVGLQVQTTNTLNTYTYHKLIAREADVVQLSDDINDFFARYRVGSSNPTTDLDSGDLFFNTGSGKMLVYDGTSSAWEEVQSIGNFSINTLSSSAGTGGGSATFNGTAYRFTLSDAPAFAEQLIVSINGVVQKPNSGTAQPSEGFAIDGADIIFSDPPATSSPFFIITMGSTVNIGTPSDNTVTAAKIVDGSITNAEISSSAAIASSKLAKPIDFADNEKARFGTGNDLEIYHNGNNSFIEDSGTGDFYIRGADNVRIQSYSDNEDMARFIKNGAAQLYYDNSKKLETTSTGVDVTGSVTCDGLTSDGSITIDGNLRVRNSGVPILTLQDSGNTGTGATAYIQAQDSAGVGKFRIGDESGANENLDIRNYATADILLSTNNGGKQIYFTSAGHWVPADNNAQDLGTSSTQWRDGYFDGTVNCDGLSCVGDATIGNTTGILNIKDTNSTGNANVNFIRGTDSAATVKWYVGHTSSSNQDLYVANNAGGQIQFQSSGTTRFTMQAAGHLVPETNNATDLGTSSNRWRNVYANTLYGDGSNLTGISSGATTVKAYVTFNNSGSIQRSSGISSVSGSNGQYTVNFSSSYGNSNYPWAGGGTKGNHNDGCDVWARSKANGSITVQTTANNNGQISPTEVSLVFWT